ncbi:anti-sigma regulatory factor (Ser/Thr protein kinase) [Streptomyces calvus]|uniref:ATP-binding protein n=1 Tax=Streptomyces calvus TaxID=67282 RepID=A0A514JJE1_9ACTN|nr:ATP-binding protein [Streptomyces calvus]QDI67424.1 ATP-binding protein [Streptomyces calvus]
MARLPLPSPLHPARNEPSPRTPGGERTAPLPQPDGLGRLASGPPVAHAPRETRAFDLSASPASVRTARDGVRELLAARGAGTDICDNAVIVTSELVTNALTHSAGDRIVCRVRVTADRVRIEVEDQARSPELPLLRRPGPDDQNGRGLLLVDALSSDWAVSHTPGRPGRVVWAELELNPPSRGAVGPRR